MFDRSRWLVLSLLLAGAPGCALYFEPNEGEGSAPTPGGGGGMPDVPTDPLPPDSTPEPQPLPLLPPSGLELVDTADGGNAGGVHACGGTYVHYEHSAGTGTQLHVIGIYEAEEADGLGAGSVDVQVTRPGPSVLVLSAFNPTHWNVQVGPGAFVERIVLSGYYAQSVDAPEGAKIESYAVYGVDSYWLGFGYDWPSHYSYDLVDKAQSLTGLELTSFRGCYFGGGFQIDTPVEIREPHVVSDKVEPTLPAGCEDVIGDPRYCLSMKDGKAVVIGLQSSTVCESYTGGIAGGLGTPSLGWQGDYAYGCIYDRGVARISLVDGSVDVAPVSCDAVALHGDDLLVMPFGGYGVGEYPLFSVLRFDDFAAAARREVAEVAANAPWVTLLAVDGDRGYFAWHVTGTIETAELSDGAEMTPLLLEGYDDPIYGLEVIDGMLLVVGKPGLHAFDATTGEALGVLFPEYSGDGLTCVSNVL